MRSASLWAHLSKAMVKSMLTSPGCDAHGYSNTFNMTDFASLKAGGSNRNAAAEASTWIIEAERFLHAYARCDEAAVQRLMNALEVRIPMFVHQKKADTRASFSSLAAIAAAFYTDAKAIDPRLPKWAKLPEDATPSSSKSGASKIGALRETSGDFINEGILAEKGFLIDTRVVDQNSGNTYKIAAFNADELTALLTLVKAKDPKAKKKPTGTLTVQRLELMQGVRWHIADSSEPVFMQPSQFADPLENFDLKAAIIAGALKHHMALEFAKSSEDGCKVQLSPNVQVIAARKFGKGAFKLVGLTNHVSVVPDGKVMLTANKCVGKGDGWIAYCRSSNESPSIPTNVCFFAKFWAVQNSFDQSAVNCEYQDKEVEIIVQGEKLKIMVPMLVNTKPMDKDEHIVVLKVSEHVIHIQPPLKKHKGPSRAAPKKKRSANREHACSRSARLL